MESFGEELHPQSSSRVGVRADCVCSVSPHEAITSSTFYKCLLLVVDRFIAPSFVLEKMTKQNELRIPEVHK